MEREKIEATLEAVLFAMGDAVEVEKLAAAIGHDKDTTRKLMHQMMDHYNSREGGMEIIELEEIRGVNSDHALNRLVEYRLVGEAGRLDAPGKPILFGTTEEFLRNFGVRSTEELPSIGPEMVEEMKNEAEEEVQLRLEL